MDEKRLIEHILPLLKDLYPDISPLLQYQNCFQLLIAVMLSAQCTDVQVNKVTPELFRKFPGSAELAGASVIEIESIIFSTGFYKNKAKNIIAAAEFIDKQFGGSVPQAMKDLLMLPGIGRKSANVIRAHCFSLPAIIVDTHFSRVTQRIGLVHTTVPAKIELEIAHLVPETEWTGFSMRINLYGRYVCTARSPKCDGCVLRNVCAFKASLQQ